MSFIVNFCANWDGGLQERDTAVAAVKAGYGDCTVTAVKHDSYPIEVSVVNAADDSVLWKGSQKKLFGKYKKDRTASIKAIKAAVAKLKN